MTVFRAVNTVGRALCAFISISKVYIINISVGSRWKTYYGGYGTVPITYVSNIILTVGGDTVNIPPAAYADIYNINFTYADKGTQRSTNGVYRSKDGHRIYIYVFSKDNKGSYEVTWVIQDKQYLRRVLDYGFM